MNAIETINQFLIGQETAQEKIQQLLSPTQTKSPILNREFYQLAEKIVSQIPGFETIAEALLTAEKPSKIDPQVLLRLWILIAEALPQLNASFDAHLSQQLKDCFQTLCLQNADQRFTSPEWITNNIRSLSKGETFRLLLPFTTPFGKTLENVVVYKKNQDDTFNIQFFNAHEGCWDKQGGEKALDHEKVFPSKLYTNIPEKDLWGPGFTQGAAVHAKVLSKATQDSTPQAIVAAFEPLKGFLTPPQGSRYIEVGHAHALKGMHAFLYATLAEKVGNEQALDSYKSFMCITRLVLSIALMKSLHGKDGSQMHDKLGFLSEATLTTAHQVQKTFNYSTFKPLYEPAIGTLEQLKNWADKHQREYVPLPSLNERKMQDNQLELMKNGLEASKQFLQEQKPLILVHETKERFFNDGLKPPEDPFQIIGWFKNVEIKVKQLANTHPDEMVPFLLNIISNLELPRSTSIWTKLSGNHAKECLRTIHFLTEQLAKHAFQHQRFSLGVQNQAARLLLIAHRLTECFDDKKILVGFKPELKGYIKLTTSPYFRCTNYKDWQQRQELLIQINEWGKEGKKPLWRFKNKDKIPFENTLEGCFTEGILNAYPEISRQLQEELKKIRQRKDLEDYRSLLPGQLLLSGLVNAKIHENITIKFNQEELQPLSDLAQIAMHNHVLSDYNYRPQEGFENFVNFRDGINFDLSYTKKQKNRVDFHAEVDPKNQILAQQRNLFPKEKWIQSQNELMGLVAKNDEETSPAYIPFEESTCETSLSNIQLLGKLKERLADLENQTFRSFLEPYFFKIQIKDGKESFPLEQEILNYPTVFNEILKEFFKTSDCLEKGNKFNEKYATILHFSIRLHSVAKELSCVPVLQTLQKFHDEAIQKLTHNLEHLNERQNKQQCANIRIFLLKLLELQPKADIDWDSYVKWGEKLQEQIEQKEISLDPMTVLWWNQLRFKMAHHFHILNEPDLIEEGFDLMAMSHGKGIWQPIPANIAKHPEFIRLFSDRVSFWKVDPENQKMTFSDTLTGKYQLTHGMDFPKNLQRWIDSQWHQYIPDNQVTHLLHLPKALRQESIWWLNTANYNEAKGYFKGQPEKLWMKRDKEGSILFIEGPARGMRLELVKHDEEALSPLEIHTGTFGGQYHAYKPNFVGDRLIEYRDLIVFLNLRTLSGDELVFERKGHEFFEQGYPDRELKECIFAPCIYHENNGLKQTSSALKIYGLAIHKRKQDTLRYEEENSILLPFQRHVSNPHSHVVHGLTQKITPDSPSLLNAIEIIEIKTNARGLSPETPREYLFSAYLSLIGKEYQESAKFLKNIRPSHRLDDKDKQILRWIIDSAEDANDHSSTAAVIKLMAYKIWEEQGGSNTNEINSKELPQLPLDRVFLDYISHHSSVPMTLQPTLELKTWLKEKGFIRFPVNQERIKEWGEEFCKESYKTEVFQPMQPSRQSLFTSWNDPYLIETLDLSTLSATLLDGIQQPQEHRLVAGKPYPMGAFGYHYKKFSQNGMTEQEKWELIYSLETVEMQDFIKNALKIAFQKREQAPVLPQLNSKSKQQNMHLLESWFKDLLLSTPVRPRHDVRELRQSISSTIPSTAENISNISLGKKIADVCKENRPSAKELLQVLQRSFADHSLISESFSGSSPFVDEVDDPTFDNEIKSYHQEWNKGKDLLNAMKTYELPNLDKIKELDRVLLTYSNEMQKEMLQIPIMQILNRRPVGHEALMQVRLSEVQAHKVQMNLDDALKMVFLPTEEQKLAFLRKSNPFLEAEDVTALNLCVQEYLDWAINDKMLEQLKNKVKAILTLEQEVGNLWHEHATVQELWQEIGELLNPYNSYSNDPQTKRETLLFEYLCGFRIREEQAKTMHTLIETIFHEQTDQRSFSAVFQMIMGGGKTSVILAQMAKLAAKKGRVPLFIAHHSQYPSLKANLVNNQYNRLDQDVIDIDFKREELASINVLKFIYTQLANAQSKGHLLLMKTSFLLMLRLEFIDQLKSWQDPQNLDPHNQERIKELAKILSFIMDKEKTLLLGDEIDSILNILEEVNFPAGLSVVITKSSLDLIKQVYSVLATHPTISADLKLIQDDQSLVSKKRLLQNIFPTLVETLIDDYAPLSSLIPPTHFQVFRSAMQEYILGKMDGRLKDGIQCENEEEFLSSLLLTEEEKLKAKRHLAFLRHIELCKKQGSEESRRSLAAVALLKELCTEILPITLGKSHNHNYGFLENGKIIPYLGVNAPNLTEFGNIYVTACCYFQGALQKGVDETRLKKYRDMLREASLYYSEIFHCAPEETVEAQHFKTLTDLDLHQEWSEQNLQTAIQKINLDPQRCLDFFAEFSSQNLRYHTSLLNCGPIALTHLFGQFIGCSATLWNRETFEKRIAESCKLEQGTEGKILVKFFDDLAKGKSFLSVIDQATPHQILDAVMDKRTSASTQLRALIDAGALLKRYKNRAVAEEILKYSPLEAEVDAVIFLNQMGSKESFSLLKRGAIGAIPLETTSRKEMEKHGVNPDRVFVYFDELRATGSDIPLKSNAIVAKTFNPFSTTLRTDLQANLRPRNFFRAQTVDTIILKETLEGFVNFDENAPTSYLNGKNFVLTALRNQTKLKQTQMLRSALDQVKEMYCGLIVRHLIKDFGTNEEEDIQKLELFKTAEWLFYSQFKDDPISLFLDLKKDVPAHQVVEEYLNDLRERFRNSCSPYFNEAELNSLHEAGDQILEWSRRNLLWNVPHSYDNAYLEKEVQLQTQKENQLEVNVEIQKQTQKELQKYAVRVDAPAAEYIPWERLKDPPQSFSDYRHPELMTFRKLLKRVNYDFPYHQIFPKDLYVSDNLTRSHAVDLPVFHKVQKNAYHILLIKDGEVFRPLFIDLKEAAFWREEIKQFSLNDCWLCDLEGHLLNENKYLPKEALEILKRAQWWGHFFNGNASYLRAFPQLVQQEMKIENFTLKYQFLLSKTRHDPIQSRVLAIDPLLADKPVEAPVFQFHTKSEEEEWKQKELSHLSDHELNQMPYHFARFLNPEQVPKLKRAGFFSYLPSEMFEYVLPSQVPLIPSHRLQYLIRKEQVRIVPPEKIVCLRGKALEFIPEQYLDRIHPEMLAFLLPDMQMKYQYLQVQKRGLEAFGKSIEPPAVPVIWPECVPFISERCLPFLETAEQLAYVNPNKYSFLNARQFHLVPKENWVFFTFSDYEKYKLELRISSRVLAFIQQMPIEWVNQVDPRLAQFYSQEQVEKIERPQFIPYLDERQLQWLNPSLTSYLNNVQISELSSRHRHLIARLEDPKIIHQLSNDALGELSIQQIQKIEEREVLLRLKSDFYQHLLPKQIELLQVDQQMDQAIIQYLNTSQLKGQELEKFLPFLSLNTLQNLEMGLFSEIKEISLEVRRRLSSLQLQCFLNGVKQRKRPLASYLKETISSQWRGMDPIFIESFFKDQHPGNLQYVPKAHVKFLAREALLKWHGASKFRDVLSGISSFLFYPLVLISAFTLLLFAQQKKVGLKKVFRRLVLSPLRLIARESFYRIISQ